MKLSDHVNKLRELILSAFDKDFSRLGIGKTSQMEIDRLPEGLRPKRHRFEEMLQSHVGETGGYEQAREKLIDELTFTLFNRLAAVKVMESAGLFPPVLTKLAEHGDRSFGHKAWLEVNPHMRSEELEGIREYIKYAFDELGQTLPLYARTYPYALLPDVVSLNEIIDAFNEVERDAQVGADIWTSDDVLGWAYESYNSVKKQAHKDSKEKTEYNKVSLQSQVYTPRWVVQFLVENSLGKLYLEMFPDSEIKDRFKIANPPATKEREVKPLHEVKVIDPACGSGNFLLYAFDFFYELYLDQIENYGADYEENDIPRLIVEHNLHGVDLDDRAVQLAQLGLFIKAKKKRRSIGQLSFNIVSSDFFLPEYEEVERIFDAPSNIANSEATLTMEQKDFVREIWDELKFAYKFGALIRISERFSDKLKDAESRADQGELFAYGERQTHEDFSTTLFQNLRTAVEKYAQARGNTFLTSKTRDAITFLELLTTEYDVATANPPYTPRGDYGSHLKDFIDKNYRKPYDTHVNLYSCFIQRIDQLLCDSGKMAMVTPMTFMFIATFEDTRKLILTKYHINLFVQYGFGGMFSESVDPAMFVLDKGTAVNDSTFIKLDMYFSDSKIELFSIALTESILGQNNDHVFYLKQGKILEIASHPFIFWISEGFRDKFKNNLLDDFVKVCVGLQTGSNERFLRFWWELAPNNESIDPKWVGYCKGGAFNKWQGNLWLKVYWEDDGFAIKSFFGTNGRLRSRPQNEQFYFREGITYSASGRGGYAFRHLPPDHIFDVGGSSIFPVKSYRNFNYLIAFLNSKLAFYIADCLNPTANIQVGDLKRVPFVIPDNKNEQIISSLAKQNIELTKDNLKRNIIEPTFETHQFSGKQQWLETVKSHLITSLSNQVLILINQAVINDKIFDVYSLSPEDKLLVITKQNEDVANLPVTGKARSFFLTNNEYLLNDLIIEKIIEAPICEAKISGETQAAVSLALKGTNLEDICKKHLIHPLDILFEVQQLEQTKFSTGFAQEVAFEFLTHVIRQILMEDEDGIIPLVPNAGEKVLLDRIEEKFVEEGFSLAQYSSFDSILGHSINEFLTKAFFKKLSDHVNVFSYLPKTPFIWHLSSGPEQGFDCYLIIYKWSRDGLMRLRSVYVEHRERSLINRRSDLADNESAEAQNEKDRIFKQLQEIEDFKAKIDELLAEGYDPILDDGVGKNIAPLQQKKLIPYEVLNEGQLKKYLNADW